MGVGRLLAGALFLAFALSLLPGMFGVRLGDLESFVPAPTSALAFGGGAGGGEALVFRKNQYREALEQGRKEGKRVFLDFTGYSCSNCKWMKGNMFPKPEVTAELKKFVLVELYTDGTDAASEANQQLQEKKFATVAIPFYAIVDSDEKVYATFPRLTRDSEEFVKFLRTE